MLEGQWTGVAQYKYLSDLLERIEKGGWDGVLQQLKALQACHLAHIQLQNIDPYHPNPPPKSQQKHSNRVASEDQESLQTSE